MIKAKFDAANMRIDEAAKREGELMSQFRALSDSMETMRKQNTENVEKLVSSTIKKGK